MERRSVVAGGRGSSRRARRVLGGLLGCICAPLVAPAQAAFALTVSAGTVNAVEGTAFTGQVATFSDLTGLTGCQAISNYASTVSWSDDRTTSAATIGAPAANGLTCVYPVSAQHRFTQIGNAVPFTVSVTGPFGGSGSASGSADVTAAPLTSQAVGVSAVEGQPFTATVANFTDGFAGRPASHYTASVAWGDGTTTSPASVIPTADGSFDVDATHTYANYGSYPTTITITDPDGSRTTAVGSSVVADAPLTSTVTGGNTAIEGDAFTATLATFTDGDPGRPAGYYAAAVDWGDGSVSTPAIVAEATGAFDVVAGHTYANPGAYTTTVTIVDPGGAQTTAVGHVMVADAPLSSTGVPVTGDAGTPLTATVATFADANPGRPAGYYAASVDWGDGSTSGASVVADAAGGFDVTGTHTYAAGGSFPIRVTISDPGGSTTVALATASVTAPPPPPPPPPTPAVTLATTPAVVSTPPVAKPTVLPTPKVSLTSPRLSAGRSSISITVTCPTGGASCQGVVRLTTLPAAGSKVAALRRGATLGSVLFVLHPGQVETFSVHIASQTLRLLREAGTARVQGVAVAFGKLGNATSTGAVAKIADVKAPATPKSKPKPK